MKKTKKPGQFICIRVMIKPETFSELQKESESQSRKLSAMARLIFEERYQQKGQSHAS